MRNLNRIVFFGLIAATIFLIFNCIGYVVIFILTNNSNSAADADRPAANAPLEADVVAFVTAAPEMEIPPIENTATPEAPLALLPTITPAPFTSTPSSIDTPTPTRPPPRPVTVVPGQLEVISHKSYVDDLGWYHIVGEVQNNAGVPMEYVEVVAKLYDSSNQNIGTKLTFTAPDIIFPGGSAAFDIIALRKSQWSDIETYTLQVKGDPSQNAEQQNLILISQDGRLEDNLILVSGQVQNIGDSPALAKLIITLYDADHNVVNTAWAYADAGIIPVNGVSDFELKVEHQIDPNNFEYRIQIEEELVDAD